MKKLLILFALVGLTSCSKEPSTDTKISSTDPVLKLAIEPQKRSPISELPAQSTSVPPNLSSTPARNTNLIEISIPDNPPEKLTQLLEKMKNPDFKASKEELDYLYSFQKKKS